MTFGLEQCSHYQLPKPGARGQMKWPGRQLSAEISVEEFRRISVIG